MIGTLKLIAGGLLALICCYIGSLIKKRYKERAKFYASAEEYAAFLFSELSYKKTPLNEAANLFVKGRSGDFEDALIKINDAATKGMSFDDCYKNVNINLLKDGEKKEFLLYLLEPGKSLLDDQLAFVKRFEADMASKKQKAQQDSAKLGGMYFKLFVLLGLAIILILA